VARYSASFQPLHATRKPDAGQQTVTGTQTGRLAGRARSSDQTARAPAHERGRPPLAVAGHQRGRQHIRDHRDQEAGAPAGQTHAGATP